MDALHGDDEPAFLAAADASLTDDADRRVRRAGEVKSSMARSTISSMALALDLVLPVSSP